MMTKKIKTRSDCCLECEWFIGHDKPCSDISDGRYMPCVGVDAGICAQCTPCEKFEKRRSKMFDGYRLKLLKTTTFKIERNVYGQQGFVCDNCGEFFTYADEDEDNWRYCPGCGAELKKED